MASSQIQIASNRKTSLLKQNMREIAMYLNEDPPKEEKARLRTEAFIRDDNITQAYDILNLQCNLLVERVKLIEQSKNKKCPSDILSCVATLIYAEPFVDIKEFSLIRKQLYTKYGRDFENDALANKGSIVNEKIVLLLSAYPSEPHVVQNYMIRICKQYEVDWKPISMIAQTQPSNPPSSSVAPSSIPAVAVRATSIQQDGSDISKSEWVDEYEFYNIQTVDGVVHATIEGSQSQQNRDGFDNKMILATSETVAEAVLVDEQPMSKGTNSFANKSFQHVGSSPIDNNEKDSRGFLEHRPPATAPVEHKTALSSSLPESSKLQQQESENVENTEQSTSTSTYQNNINNLSKNDNRETRSVKELDDSSATYIDATSHEMRQQSLQERLDNLQNDHKEREQNFSSTGVCSQELKKIHLDDKIGETIDSSVEDEGNEEVIEVAPNNESDNIISKLTKRKEEGQALAKREEEEAKVKEYNVKESEEEETTAKMLAREGKDIPLEQVNCCNKKESNDQLVVETNGVEQLTDILIPDHSFAGNRSLQETGMILGKEHDTLNIKSEMLPVLPLTESGMTGNEVPKQLPESTITANQKQHSTETLVKEVEISIPTIPEKTTTSEEVPAAVTTSQTKPLEVTGNTQEEIETPSSKNKEEKKTHHMLTTAAGVAGGIAGLVAPVVAVGVVAGVGSAMIAKKVGKKIKKQHKKNKDHSLKRDCTQGTKSTAGSEIFGKINTFARTLY